MHTGGPDGLPSRRPTALCPRTASLGPLAAVLPLLVGLTACSVGAPGASVPPKSGVLVPKVFYLPPHGDTSGPGNKVPFHVSAQDTAVPDRTGAADHRLTIDLVGGAGAVRLWIKSGRACAGSATHVVCEVKGQYDSWTDGDRVYPVATKRGRPGDAAVIRYSFTTRSGGRVTARTRVVVGEPVVKLRVERALDDVRPGAGIGTAVAVRNTGEVPVVGLGLRVGSGEGEFRQRYSNCRYPPQHHGHDAICSFPGLRIAPGETVAVRPTLPLRAAQTAIFSSVSRQAWPLDEGPPKDSAVPDNGDRGDGPALEAVVVPRGEDGGTFVDGPLGTPVTLDLHADFRVTVSELHVGEGRKLRITVRNDGPGDPGSYGRLSFTPPPGAVVRKQPMEAIEDDEYEPACPLEAGTYTCPVHGIAPGDTRTFDFTLDLPQPGTGHAGLRMKVLSGGRDPSPSDNAADVTVLP